jgi:hypothetical protein
VIAGVEDYPSFAPEGWTAPALDAEVEHLRTLLADDGVWCLLAESDGEPFDDPTPGLRMVEYRYAI